MAMGRTAAILTGLGAAVLGLAGPPPAQAVPTQVDLANGALVRANGETAAANAGAAVADAGDVNGDGRRDMIVGAHLQPDGVGTGAAYVIFGQPGTRTVNLRNLGSAGFKIKSDPTQSRAFLGNSVAAAGDVNGDRLADVIVGAGEVSYRSRSRAGAAWVIFGKRSTSTVRLDALGTQGFRIDGAAAGDRTATFEAVRGGADVNGDGKSDVVVGAPGASPAGRGGAGSAYVVFGKSSSTTVDLATLGSGGIRINGASALDAAGVSVSLVGDMNGDRRAEVVVGAPVFDRTDVVGNTHGAAYVVFAPSAARLTSVARSATPLTVDLARLGTQGIFIPGPSGGAGFGMSVFGMGDANRDGRSDLVVGAPNEGFTLREGLITPSNDLRARGGTARVIYGRAGASTVDARRLGSAGYVILGAGGADRAGASVAPAGDVDRDGRADVIVGAPSADRRDREDSGAAFVVFSPGPGAVVNLAKLCRGMVIDGAASRNEAGSGVAGAGDVSGDGIPDLLVGGRGANAAFVVRGEVADLAGRDTPVPTSTPRAPDGQPDPGCNV